MKSSKPIMKLRLMCIDCESVDHKKLSDRKRECKDCGAVFYVSPAETRHFRPWKWWVLTVVLIGVIVLTFATAGLYALEGQGKWGLIFVGLGILFAVERRDHLEEAIQSVR